MNTNQRNDSILIFGLPESGKTTFLGALSYLMQASEVDTSLKHAGLPRERAYMNRLSQRWCMCEPMERTRINEEESVTLHFSKDGNTIGITFPDLSGEAWLQMWGNHQCTEEFVKMTNNASALILFIHADSIKKPLSVVDFQSMVEALGSTNDPEVNVDPVPWDATSHTPTQVMLVALLQLLARPPMGSTNPKVAIVLSAWDKILDDVCPEEFLQDEMPLLYQYLSSGFDYHDWKAFGVSAQGGDLSNGEKSEKEKLLSFDQQSERIIVQDCADTTHDLTTILEWTLKL
tara:strand:+ start:459 stop:1325 length:867 start_codon:yes stop_codon:yes gene_type:complete